MTKILTAMFLLNAWAATASIWMSSTVFWQALSANVLAIGMLYGFFKMIGRKI